MASGDDIGAGGPYRGEIPTTDLVDGMHEEPQVMIMLPAKLVEQAREAGKKLAEAAANLAASENGLSILRRSYNAAVVRAQQVGGFSAAGDLHAAILHATQQHEEVQREDERWRRQVQKLFAQLQDAVVRAVATL